MKDTVYSKYIKRILDIICALAAIIVFCWLYVILIVLGLIFMRGNPFFVQERPGKDEKIFKMLKFRTMDNSRDSDGNLLPDKERVNKYGRFLRATSLDELPEAFNILIGDMSVVGPRPQLVRDMVFMTDEQRKRHTVRPGLSGLAQVNGRNDIDWEEKFEWDLVYIKDITFGGDLKIVLKTVKQAFFKREGAVVGNLSTAEDFGDYLLSRGKVDQSTYDQKQESAKELLNTRG
ncbi:MAG: sugar transferase [Clostridia bacterium]|nr:sugar transferase [Clostridia bacterium]